MEKTQYMIQGRKPNTLFKGENPIHDSKEKTQYRIQGRKLNTGFKGENPLYTDCFS